MHLFLFLFIAEIEGGLYVPFGDIYVRLLIKILSQLYHPTFHSYEFIEDLCFQKKNNIDNKSNQNYIRLNNDRVFYHSSKNIFQIKSKRKNKNIYIFFLIVIIKIKIIRQYLQYI